MAIGEDAELQTTLDIIFSCHVCQATIAEIYESPERDRGFHHPKTSAEQIVPNFWLADCGHLTCSKHLEGGG